MSEENALAYAKCNFLSYHMDNEYTQPLVSIIVPVYNGESYIKECLYSLSKQSYNEIEIILVDDGSTDNSLPIAKSLNLKTLSIVIGEHKNLPSARNKGIINSKGEFIAFCDVDDIWLPDKLKLQMTIFKKQPEIEMCFSDVICFSKVGEKRFGKDKLQLCWALNTNNSDKFNLLLHQNLMVPSTLIIKKNAINRIGMFDESLNSCEDWEFALRAAALNIQMKYLDEVTVRYRLHLSNMSSNAAVMHKGRIDVLNKIFRIKQDIRNKSRNKALAMAYKVSANAFYAQRNFEQFYHCMKKIWHFDKRQLSWKIVRRYIKALLSRKF